MDQATIVTLVVGSIVTVLGFLFRYWKPIDPIKSWLEMALAVVGSIVIAAVLGKLAPLPGAGDPLAVVQYFLTSSAVVFTFVQIVYGLIQQAFPNQAAVKRALRGIK